MLKKIMKAALAASLVFGFSTMATADVKVSGDAAVYYGQYNSGADGYTANFTTASEGHISVTGKQGPISLFLQVESRSDAATAKVAKLNGNTYAIDTDSDGIPDSALYQTDSGDNVNNAQLAVTWTSGALSVKLGTVSTGPACTFAMSNGLNTTVSALYGTYVQCSGYTEQDGIQVGYMIPAIKGAAFLTIEPSEKGQNMAFGAAGLVAGMVEFRVNQTNKTFDTWASDADTAYTDTYTHLGAKVHLSKVMSISLDISTEAMDAGAKESSNALQFRMGELGPGTAIITYATTAAENNAGVAADDVTHTGLTYKIGLGKGVGADFFYASKDNGTNASSWLGGGLTAKF